jgi:hypothetical protein
MKSCPCSAPFIGGPGENQRLDQNSQWAYMEEKHTYEPADTLDSKK